MPSGLPAVERLELKVGGQVQGVGFRPYVYRLALYLGLSGWARNDGFGLRIQVQGSSKLLEEFLRGVQAGPTGLARVDDIDVARVHMRPADGFRIRESARDGSGSSAAPDTAVCADCLSELFDPADPRHRYPFINCTRCGPRHTIISALPYDRGSTSMRAFPLCHRCLAEYRDPLDRRFHAEATACPQCGPRLTLLDERGRPVAVDDPIAAALERVLQGQIVALKGLGGFHLACDAGNTAALARLRERKRRASRPFAIMTLNKESIRPHVRLDDAGQCLLESPERPIVLLEKSESCDRLLAGVAPEVSRLGVMLPYAPLHYLWFHESAGRPVGRDWLGRPSPLLLVMTSANASGEPLVIDSKEAVERLEGIADAYLVHDRDIIERCDDSVVRPGVGGPVTLRRGRGFTPRAVRLPAAGPSVLAMGGWLKNTICVTRGDRAYPSSHIGDLANRATCRAMMQAVERSLAMFRITPDVVAHDLHPDFPSSNFARDFARRNGLPAVAVQHHHAHIAAVAAEHGMQDPVLGLALDGVGLGPDDSWWGGELLDVGTDFRRLGHLAPLALPGGDRAAREPWRMAASVLHALGRGDEIERRFPGEIGASLREVLDRDVRCPRTTSAGRLFDAAAALLGVRHRISYEAQAAMELEALALKFGEARALPGGYRIDSEGRLGFWPLLSALAEETDPARGAALFHATVAEGFCALATRFAEERGRPVVALSGGCLANARFARDLRRGLEAGGLRVLEATALPPNDGGLSYGQAWVAMRRVI